MSIAPQRSYPGKHCLVPCPPEFCDCGKQRPQMLPPASREDVNNYFRTRNELLRKNLPMIQPRHQWVVMRPLEPETKTKSGILLPDIYPMATQYQKAVVEAIGPEVEHLTVGQTVLVSKLLGSRVILNEHEKVVMKEEDVFGVITEE